MQTYYLTYTQDKTQKISEFLVGMDATFAKIEELYAAGARSFRIHLKK